MFFAFGFFCVSVLGHFNASWNITDDLFMLMYCVAGLCVRFTPSSRSGLAVAALTVVSYYSLARRSRCGWRSSTAAGSFWAASGCGGTDRWPSSTTSSTSRCG